MGDRIVVLKDGEVQQIDTPLHLYDHPANQFVAGFIGSPAMNFLPGRITGTGDSLSFAAENALTVPLTGPGAARLRGHTGGAVTLGIRPEDLYVAGSAALTGPSAASRWTLDVVEPMGNEIVLYVSRGPHAAVARVAPQPVPEPGAEIELALDTGKLHFFDAETEAALTETEAAEPA